MATKKRAKAKTRVRSRKGAGRESVSSKVKRKQSPAQRAASLRNLAKGRKVLAQQRRGEKKAAKRKAAPRPKTKRRQTKEELRQELLAVKRQLERLKKKPAKKPTKKPAKAAKKPAKKPKKLSAEEQRRKKALEQGTRLLEKLKEKQPSKKPIEDTQKKLRSEAARRIQDLIRPRKKHDEVLGSPGYNRPWLERREDGKLNIRYAYRPHGGAMLNDDTIHVASDAVYSVLQELFKIAAANNFVRYDIDVRVKVSGPAAMLYGAKYYDRVDLNVKGHIISVADLVLGFVNSGPKAMHAVIERLDEELNESSGRHMEMVTVTIYENK